MGRDHVAGIVRWEAEVNKTQLIDALAERLGDKKIAAAAVAGLVDVVVRAVKGGDKVTITGFGVFEKRSRAARMARNPRTGQSVKVKKTTVPAFRPGTLFREVVSGARKLPRVGAGANGGTAGRPGASAASHPMTGGPSTTTTVVSPLAASPNTATPSPPPVTTIADKVAVKAATKASKAAKRDSKNTTKVAAKKAVKKPVTKK
ncbi:MAG TPA: HU family DNA-binding protein [Pseudonocardiaceae bacterium]|nr:HU family DNA-binding protein [Pseudonocardiaceae bacterium]